jgi:hypothetical protein
MWDCIRVINLYPDNNPRVLVQSNKMCLCVAPPNKATDSIIVMPILLRCSILFLLNREILWRRQVSVDIVEQHTQILDIVSSVNSSPKPGPKCLCPTEQSILRIGIIQQGHPVYGLEYQFIANAPETYHIRAELDRIIQVRLSFLGSAPCFWNVIRLIIWHYINGPKGVYPRKQSAFGPDISL